jgi:tripartite-type tricarboxylate transporter receptor subunit TctC
MIGHSAAPPVRRRGFARVFQLALGGAMLSAGMGLHAAQEFPAKPIRLVVPFAPGGGLDILARLISPGLSESLGQSVVVDNRPGASGAIGLELTARAPPDGHTLILMSASHVIHAIVNQTPYDLFRDFAPVTQTSASSYVLVVAPGFPVQSVAELIAYAKSHPGKLNYASSGNATLQHLATELLAGMSGIKLLHVPYKGVGSMLPDLMAGRVQMALSSATALAVPIRSKAVRPLAVTGLRREPILANVPTMAEAGVPGFVVTQWHGVLAPAGTPREVIARLQREMATTLKQPEVAARLTNDGTVIVGSSPEEFVAFLRSEREKWAQVVKQTGMRVE